MSSSRNSSRSYSAAARRAFIGDLSRACALGVGPFPRAGVALLGDLDDWLDALPAPDRSRLRIDAYRGIAGSDQVFATMITSRGCPFRCTFCSTPRTSYRYRSVASVIEEMERCARLGIPHIYFLDDTFPTSGARADELGEVVKDYDCQAHYFGLVLVE